MFQTLIIAKDKIEYTSMNAFYELISVLKDLKYIYIVQARTH